MDDDNPLAPKTGSSAAETLEAAAARLKPLQRLGANLYRVVEVMHAPNGRVQRVGKIWHSDLDRARRFGRALAANTVGEQVQVADSAGTVIEKIPLPPPGTAPTGWGNWQAIRLPPAPSRSRPPVAMPRVPAVPAAPKHALPTVVPPILPRVVPDTVTPDAPRRPAVDLPVMPPENAVERTNPLPPTYA